MRAWSIYTGSCEKGRRVWQGLRPELVCEIAFDHITGHRIRHGAKFQRWRTDKEPAECRIDQLRA